MATLDEHEMAVVLAAPAPEVAERLIATALEKHYAHQDNLTAVVMTWEADDTTPRSVLVSAGSPIRISPRVLLGVAFLVVLLIGMALGYWQAKRNVAQGGARRNMTGANPPLSAVPSGDSATIE